MNKQEFKMLYVLLLMNSLFIVSLIWISLGWISDNAIMGVIGAGIFLIWCYVTEKYLEDKK